jgi:hypothetical protein
MLKDKPTGKILGRPRDIWEDNIIINLIGKNINTRNFKDWLMTVINEDAL